MEQHFDKQYYFRHYDDPKTQVANFGDYLRLGRFVAAYLDHLGVEVTSVLDFGCGTGRWQKVCRRVFREADYRGVELSTYACEQYGWEQGALGSWRGRGADLVVCQGVLQYVSDGDIEKALRALARHAKKALYLEVLTERDWLENCDQTKTDGDVYLRSKMFYQTHLFRDFHACGGGLYVKKSANVVFFDLERPLSDPSENA